MSYLHEVMAAMGIRGARDAGGAVGGEQPAPFAFGQDAAAGAPLPALAPPPTPVAAAMQSVAPAPGMSSPQDASAVQPASADAPPVPTPVVAPPPTPQDLTQPATNIATVPPVFNDSQGSPVNAPNGADLVAPSAPGPAPAPNAPAPNPVAEAANVPGSADLFPTIQRVGGAGVIPAHEVELRGPSVLKAQDTTNQVAGSIIGQVRGREQEAADREFATAQDQYRAAMARQAAFDQSAAQREQELADRQQDFDDSSQQLARTAINPNQFWQSRSTPQRISAMIGMALGGFIQGATGRQNPALDIINQAIDRDINSQIQNYGIQRDAVNGRQTAFGMAMQKYNNVDAARSLARASALDAVQGQIAQNAALWKGTDAQNRADMAIGALQNQKLMQLMMGTRFLQPQAVAPTWRGPDGEIYTNADLLQMKKEGRGFTHEDRGIGLHTAGAIQQDIVKGGIEQNKADREAQQSGGLSKAGQNELALDQARAERERESALGVLASHRNNVAEIAKSGMLGSAYAALPGGAPGVETARLQQIPRNVYNADVMTIVAQNFKLFANANEPRSPALIKEYAEPYMSPPGEGQPLLEEKIKMLTDKVNQSAVSKGVEPPKMSKEAQQSMQMYGGK